MPGIVNRSSPAFIQSATDVNRAMKDVETRLNRIIAEVKNASEEALLEIGQRIFDRSQELVPVATGLSDDECELRVMENLKEDTPRFYALKRQ